MWGRGGRSEADGDGATGGCYCTISPGSNHGRPAEATWRIALQLKRSFPPVVNAAARLLICGSLPGERSLAEQRYYAHPQNQFWRLLSPVVGIDLPTLDYQARLVALLGRGIGLWDVVAAARRAGSSDAAIRDPAGNDLAALVATLSELRAVAFNGATAARIGRAALAVPHPKLSTVALPSSSPLHTIGLAAKQPAWSALGEWLP